MDMASIWEAVTWLIVYASACTIMGFVGVAIMLCRKARKKIQISSKTNVQVNKEAVSQ